MNKKSSGIKCAFPNRIPKEGLSGLPLAAYSGKVILVETAEDVELALKNIAKEKLLGFDTESRPSFSSSQHFPVSIIQLCGEHCVWIFKLKNIQDLLPKIFEIFENPQIKKVGVAVKGDISALRKLCEFKPQGFEDISEKTRKIGIVNTGLRNLAAVFLGVRISKSAQMSNWANDELSSKQISYAATDAWISRELYENVNKIFTNCLYEIYDVDTITPLIKSRASWLTKLFRIIKSIKKRA